MTECKLSLPINIDQLTWKFITDDQVQALIQLIKQIEASYDLSYSTQEVETEKFFFDTTQAYYCVGAFTDENEMVAYARIRLVDEEKVVYCAGGVKHNWRNLGIGKAIVMWHKRAGYELLSDTYADCDYSVTGSLSFEISDYNLDIEPLLLEQGFKPVNRFYQMHKKLDEIEVNSDLPPFIHIQTWSDDFWETARLINNQASEQYLTLTVHSVEQWEQSFTAVDKSCSLLLLDKTTDRTNIIGYVIASKYEQDWAKLGHKESYIDFITVMPAKQQEQLLKSLLSTHMSKAKEEGMEYTALSVEPDKQKQLYDTAVELGYKTTQSIIQYMTDPIRLNDLQ